jgi:hypothetical protein
MAQIGLTQVCNQPKIDMSENKEKILTGRREGEALKGRSVKQVAFRSLSG